MVQTGIAFITPYMVVTETYLFAKLFSTNTFYSANSPNINPTKHFHYTVVTSHLESSSESEVDDQTCCVCFGEYHDDEEWVRCSCGRWLHEDCTLKDEPSALELCARCVL